MLLKAPCLLAQVLVAKYADHLSLYHQERIIAMIMRRLKSYGC